MAVAPTVRPGGDRGGVADGPLSRAANAVYWALVLELMVLLTTLPGLALLLIVEPGPAAGPLVALAALPAGPAAAGAVYAWRAYAREHDRDPARHFWRGYRLGAVGALGTWAAGLAVLLVVATNLSFRDAIGLPAPVVAVQVAVAVAVAVWLLTATVVGALFSFRWRDVAVVSARCLVRRPLGALGAVSVIVLGLGVTVWTTEVVLWALASLLALHLLRAVRPVVDEVEASFTA